MFGPHEQLSATGPVDKGQRHGGRCDALHTAIARFGLLDILRRIDLEVSTRSVRRCPTFAVDAPSAVSRNDGWEAVVHDFIAPSAGRRVLVDLVVSHGVVPAAGRTVPARDGTERV